jgi:hypothetical protein
MTTLDLSDLALVTGGVSRAPVCNRSQFDWMASHMVPESSMKPGVKRHVVAADAKLCGFPMPR